MSTDEILKCIEYAPDGLAEKAVNQLAALEESHAEMVRALMADMVLGEDGLMHDEFRCPSLVGAQCADWCATKRDVLKKAGAL